MPEPGSNLLRRAEDSYYQMLCERKIWRVLYDWFDYAVVIEKDMIVDMMSVGRSDGIIDREEHIRALRSDIIARDDGVGDREGDLGVVEASTVLEANALHDAASRAEIIWRVTGITTHAFAVAFHDWHEDLNTLAQQLSVTVIQFRPREFEDL